MQKGDFFIKLIPVTSGNRHNVAKIEVSCELLTTNQKVGSQLGNGISHSHRSVVTRKDQVGTLIWNLCLSSAESMIPVSHVLGEVLSHPWLLTILPTVGVSETCWLLLWTKRPFIGLLELRMRNRPNILPVTDVENYKIITYYSQKIYNLKAPQVLLTDSTSDKNNSAGAMSFSTSGICLTCM